MKIERPIVEGVFVERVNRFLARVEVGGRQTWAHVPNSGRLHELFAPGRPVLLAAVHGSQRKTRYDLIMVQLGNRLVSMDARLPGHLLHEALLAGGLPPFVGYPDIQREAVFGGSRLDFLLQGERRRCFIEVKSVTLVEEGMALFPDAPTLRGRRHVEALAEAVAQGERAAVVFVVQRDDADRFAPHDRADPAFGQALRAAAAAGVEVYAYTCRVSREEVILDKAIPILLQPQHGPCSH